MPRKEIDFSPLMQGLKSAGDLLMNDAQMKQQAEQFRESMVMKQKELDQQLAESQARIKETETTVFNKVTAPQTQDLYKQITGALSTGNTKLADTLWEKNQTLVDKYRDDGTRLGVGLQYVDKDILFAAGKDSKDLLKKAYDFSNRYNSLTPAEREAGANAYIFLAGDNKLEAMKQVGEIKNRYQANADVSRASGGTVTSVTGANAVNALGAQVVGEVDNRTGVNTMKLVGAQAKGGEDKTGEAIIKQLDTFKGSEDNKPIIQQITAISNAQTSLDIALSQNNPAALGAAMTQVSKASGESRITDEDIARIDPTPGFTDNVKGAYERWGKSGILPKDVKVLKAMVYAQEAASHRALLKGIKSASNRANYLNGVTPDQLEEAILKDNNVNPIRAKFLEAPDEDILKAAESATGEARKELQRILLQRQEIRK